jgi:3',5'-cyclic AMP phosphodiesterase CpdA
LRIAHLSDLHFTKICFSPFQFFSKRWLGNFNYLLFRRGEFKLERLPSLVEKFKELKIDLVLISGDLSTTSLRSEFLIGSQFVQMLKDQGIAVIVLPGNHDHYTRLAYKNKHFYQFFDTGWSKEYCLKKDGLAVKELAPGWTLIALDTACATNYVSSQGYFSPDLEERLTNLLSSLPPSQSVLLVNHFPFFQTDGPRRKLVRGEALKNLLSRFPSVKLYLHGHTHRHSIADLRGSSLPIISDSGSATLRKNGSWNLIELQKNACTIQPFEWSEGWNPLETRSFSV